MKKIKNSLLVLATCFFIAGCVTNQNQDYDGPSDEEIFQTYTNRITIPKPRLD